MVDAVYWYCWTDRQLGISGPHGDELLWACWGGYQDCCLNFIYCTDGYDPVPLRVGLVAMSKEQPRSVVQGRA